MNLQMKYFSYRIRLSINVSYDISGSITKCHNDSLGLKLVHLRIFAIFLFFFMQINEGANKILTKRRKNYVLALK